MSIDVPRAGGWRAWNTAAERFEQRLTAQVSPPVLEAQIESETRQGLNYVRIRVTVAVQAADVAEAVGAAWGLFQDAAGEVGGWDVAAARAEVHPAGQRPARIRPVRRLLPGWPLRTPPGAPAPARIPPRSARPAPPCGQWAARLCTPVRRWLAFLMTWQPELDELQRRRELAERMGGPDKIRRQHEAGRLTVRERLAALLDDGSFREIGALAGAAAYDGDGELTGFTPANFVTGTGRIDGRKVVAGGDDFTVRGGAGDAAIAGKQIYAERLANELRLPLVRLVEGTGGGGSVKMLEQIGPTYVPVNPGWDYVVDNLSVVPVIAAGLGPVAGLGAARLCAAHLSILVEGTAQLFVAGPPWCAAASARTWTRSSWAARGARRNAAVDLVAASEPRRSA